MGFSRQEQWSGLPFSIPGALPDPGIHPVSPRSPALAGGFFYHWATWEAQLQGIGPPKDRMSLRPLSHYTLFLPALKQTTSAKATLLDACELSPKIILIDSNSLKIISLFFEKKLLFLLRHLWYRGNCQGCQKRSFLVQTIFSNQRATMRMGVTLCPEHSPHNCTPGSERGEGLNRSTRAFHWNLGGHKGCAFIHPHLPRLVSILGPKRYFYYPTE